MKRTVLAALLIIALASTASAGRFGLGLGVTIFKPAEEGSSYAPMFTGHGYYWANKHVVPSLEVGYARYSIEDTTYNFMPIIPRVTYHFVLTKNVDPYAGLGLVYARKWWSGAEEGSDNMWGYAGSVGLNVAATENFGLGVGVEYVVPDAGDFDSGYPAFKLSLGAGGF
jgi:opacity protein-like surface antigen